MPAPKLSIPRLARFVLTLVVMSALAVGVGMSSARAGDETLYGALILATKTEHPVVPPAELRTQAANLETIFGYNQFRILGEKRKAVASGTEDWLVPSRKFFLRVDTKSPLPDGYALGLELLRDEKVIISADVKLGRARPLYIRGPFVGEGQLIILLMVL